LDLLFKVDAETLQTPTPEVGIKFTIVELKSRELALSQQLAQKKKNQVTQKYRKYENFNC